MTKDDISRFWSLVDIPVKPLDCWEWRGQLTNSGYGHFAIGLNSDVPGPKKYIGKKKYYAHVISYSLLIGRVIPGQDVDHLCRNRKCVNPNHLEPVTHKENVLRGASFAASNARKTHCVNGHPLVEGNIYRDTRGGRNCIVCRKIRMEKFREKNPRTKNPIRLDDSDFYRDIPGMEGYKVGRDRTVWSCRRNGVLTGYWHKVKPYLERGYLYIKVRYDGRNKTCLVSTLLRRAFDDRPLLGGIDDNE